MFQLKYFGSTLAQRNLRPNGMKGSVPIIFCFSFTFFLLHKLLRNDRTRYGMPNLYLYSFPLVVLIQITFDVYESDTWLRHESILYRICHMKCAKYGHK